MFKLAFFLIGYIKKMGRRRNYKEYLWQLQLHLAIDFKSNFPHLSPKAIVKQFFDLAICTNDFYISLNARIIHFKKATDQSNRLLNILYFSLIMC